jgi:hypothetical protein
MVGILRDAEDSDSRRLAKWMEEEFQSLKKSIDP